ncbi:cytochrome c [Synechocystis sp. FACHB-383]|uniref:c-type cytochrome n=1 Tax=Synechocystis sp. FACHB-383 TaxID=2692864 RepID=UPI0016864F87|nr:cytochrome c [Synechocystis sp. FACHB-383]MBD2654560.1 cytochrome c [Synechocystis sp. FACHB-383]
MKHLIRRSLAKNKFISIWLFISMLAAVLLYACMSPLPTVNSAQYRPVPTSSQNGNPAMAQQQIFASNGERIYFTTTSDRGTNITATGIISSGGIMGNGGMMGNSFLTCASCHGSDGRGGVHTMMGMQRINAPDIRWSALKDEFIDDEKFRLAIAEGQDPDGEKMLNRDMPRWQMGDEDLADLIGFLKTL